MEIEEINKKIKEKQELISNLYDKIRKEELEALDLIDKRNSLDESLVQVICPNCIGKGYIKKDNKNIVCEVCRGKGYIWMKKWG